MSLTVGQARYAAGALLEAAGMSRENAEVTARAIVLADVWGVGSHGLLRLPYYLERSCAGGYPPAADLRAVTDSGPLVVWDGGGGLGHWQLWTAATVASERAARYGIAAAAVGNSGHCGALGVYTLPALERGLLALVFSNGPAVMPAWGSATPLLSTSPLAAGIPCAPRAAIVDMATSAVSRGKIASYAQRGEPLPAGWGLDAQGNPTEDAQSALMGMLSPLGGAKGFALAFLVESLSAGLVGPTLSADVADMFDPADAKTPQSIAHLVVVLDPSKFDVAGGPEAGRRLTDLADRVRSSGARVPGAARRLPDEIDDAEVLSLAPSLEADLRSWAVRLDVPAFS
ncbi:Ldh family oxidoreductase [Micromonospora yasonensis]|uniref:Ldh family oxidoreductase n=1 Tax=Micromonospora yasonensis TaxID=1128667 RepID=UPI00222F01A6|nr:Ldh family oxidoreductase [Micromonospora yasonensis]MCW3840696.1 Ldh family oxidoreductase [Micromonospora yasonensis]